MTTTELIIQLIPLAVPILIAVLKRFVPKLPKLWLPILAPVLGAGIEILAHFQVSTGTLTAAILGAAGVGLREIYDQIRKATTAPAGPQ